VATGDLELRSTRYAALGDPLRLAIVDELGLSDLTPGELQARIGVGSNLLAHHLDVLESAGLVARSRSSGDGRRRYVHLRPDALSAVVPPRRVEPCPVLFVCTANSARSQLAAALWRALTRAPADSAGTHPAATVHPGAIAAARRAGVDLRGATPRALSSVRPRRGRLVVTVCDQAHEELGSSSESLHWSIADPVPVGTSAAFDAAVDELRARIGMVVSASGARS